MTPPASRRLDVQGLRAVAVVLVVAFHAGLPVPGGYLGVDVFFVISGYVITGALLRELDASGRLDLPRFYRRRARRLLPAVTVMAVVTGIGGALLLAPFTDQRVTAWTLLGLAAYLPNVLIWLTGTGYFASGIVDPLLHTWSLGVEEQFYLLFPLVLLGLWRVARGRLAAAVAVAVVVPSLLLSLALTAAVAGEGARGFAFYGFPARAWEFGVGAVVAAIAMRADTRPRAARAPLATRWFVPLAGEAGLALILVAAFRVSPGGVDPTLGAVPAVAGAALVVAGGRGVVARTLATAPMTRIGDLSYGWYLWHWPAVLAAQVLFPGSHRAVLVAAVASAGLGLLSQVLVEDPLRHRTPRPGGTRRLVAVCVAATSVVGAGLLTGAATGWGRASLQADAAALERPPAGWTEGCLGGGTVPLTPPADCVWDVPEARGTILLFGDSHAAHLSDGLLAVARKDRLSLVESTGSGCPVGALAPEQTKYVTNCGEFQRQRLSEAVSSRPALVVVSHDSQGYAEHLGGDAAAWAATLSPTLDALDRAGVPVLVVQGVPRIGADHVLCRFGAVRPLTCSSPAPPPGALAGRVRAAERAVADRYPNVTVLDVTDAFCNATTCDAVQDGRLRYLDDNHLNAAGSEYLVPRLQTAVGVALARGTRAAPR